MSIIPEVKGKIKWLARKTAEPDIFTALVVILVAFLSFGLGRLSVIETRGSQIEVTEIPPGSAGAATVPSSAGQSGKNAEAPASARGRFVASKSGTKYYFPWCSGATRIKEENKVWFQTAEEAKGAGYAPASACQGL